MLCGNKIDLADARQVSEAEGKQMAENYKIKYFEASAKENIGLTEMMECIIEKTYARKFGEASPATAASRNESV